MKVPLWRLRDGPGWTESVEAAENDAIENSIFGPDRFQANLEAICDALAYNPFEYSRPLVEGVDDDLRYGTTKDVAAGYRLVVLVRLHRMSRTIERAWMTTEWIAE